MKRLLASVILASVVFAAVPAGARTGIGIIAGEPTGLSLKTWLDDRHAVDVALGWSFSGNTNLHAHADYLWHDFGLLRPSGMPGQVPVYYGVGARFKLHDDDRDDDRLGVRIPLGVSWVAAEAPLDVFLELAPVLDLVPSTDLDLDAAIGVRFWFR